VSVKFVVARRVVAVWVAGHGTILLVRRWIHTAGIGEVALVPEDMRRWLPPGHLAWKMIAAVGRLDLSELVAAYRADGQGQAPYDPAMMLTVIYYCYYKGITSSRGLRDACVDDVGCRVIAGGARPSNKAFAEFRRRHRKAISRLFAQVLGLLKAEGVIGADDDVAAIDGSPAPSDASLYSNLTAAQLDRKIAEAEQQLEAAAGAWAGEHAAAGRETLWDDDGPGGGPAVPAGQGRKLAAVHRRLLRLKAARARAGQRAAAGPDGRAAEAAAKAAARAQKAAARLADAEAGAAAKMARYQQCLDAGKPWPYGKKPVPARQSAKVAKARKNAATAAARLEAALERAAGLTPVKVSATDPDSRVLPGKNGGWLQGCNIEASAGRRQVLYAIELHDNPSDAGALVPMVRATDASCDAAAIGRLRKLLADCGFASEKNFTALEADKLRLLVAVSKEAIQAGRRDGAWPVPGPWQDMAAQFDDPDNKALYKKRAAYVEPFFSQFFQRFGRRIPYRGTSAIDAELKLRGQVHNISKLFGHWHPVPAPG
jgi:transposase